MQKPFFILILLTLIFGSCIGRAPSHISDAQLENRIDDHLRKRVELVKGNPVYLELVSNLQKGRAQLGGREYGLAFSTFSDIIKEKKFQNFAEYTYAKYYLAVSLQGMGVSYGALLYFVDIVEKEPARAHTFDSLKRAINLAQELKDDQLILYLAAIIPANKVPKSLAEEFRYFQAKDAYNKNDFNKAQTLLENISIRNRLYLASRYLLGAMYAKQQKYQDAIKVYRAVSTLKSAAAYYDEKNIRDLSDLALARLLYEEKNYPLAILYYKKVNNDSPFFPQALYEASWALFKMQKYNEALAVILSLHTPFIEQDFFLKSYILEGAIYLDLCRYDDVLRSLGIAERDFLKLANQIDNFARQAKTAKDYYPILSKKIKKDDELVYAYKDLFNVAAANRDFLGVHRYIRSLQDQRDTLTAHPSPRARLIANLVKQKELELMNKASFLAGEKLLETRRLIEDIKALRTVMKYEITSSERKILQSRSRRLAPPIRSDADLLKPEFTESLRDTLIWWDFEDEFWEDEIGFYLYNIESLCKDAEKKNQGQS